MKQITCIATSLSILVGLATVTFVSSAHAIDPGKKAKVSQKSLNADAGKAPLPVRLVKDLPQPVAVEKVFHVKTAQVVWANYGLIRKDFPFLARKSESKIDVWLESQAIISEAQTQQSEFNTPIEIEATSYRGLRPKRYGRAMVVDNGRGFIDAKGAGSDNPRYDWEDGDPRDGVYTLAAGIRELLFSELTREILIHSGLKIDGQPVRAIGAYAVLNGGFSAIHRNKKHEEIGRNAWGYYFRQSHTRFEDPKAADLADQGNYYLWTQAKSLEVEKVLRRYGITSEGSGRGNKQEGGINIQGTKGNAILDFGNYVVREFFPERPVHHFSGKQVLMDPKGKNWVQPNPELQVPEESWGAYEENELDSQKDKPWVYSVRTADSIAEMASGGNIQGAREAMNDHMQNMLGNYLDYLHALKAAPVKKSVRENGSTCASIFE